MAGEAALSTPGGSEKTTLRTGQERQIRVSRDLSSLEQYGYIFKLDCKRSGVLTSHKGTPLPHAAHEATHDVMDQLGCTAHRTGGLGLLN